MYYAGPVRPGPRSEADLVAALHDVGNALTVISGWLAEAQRALPVGASADQLRTALELCERRSRRAVALCRRSIGAESPPESPELLSSVVSEAGLSIHPASRQPAAQGGVAFEERVAPSAIGVCVPSASDLVSILTNLVLNAADALAARGAAGASARKIEIACSAHDGRATVRVTDSGPGLDPSVKSRLFTRGTTTKATGAGVGLAHARALAEQRGGTLDLVESRPGATTFELTWPTVDLAVPSRSMEETPHTLRKRDLRGVKIAVVDDDAGVVELLEMVLTARGATVRAFPRYEPFAVELEASKDGAPAFDVLLLDASPLGKALEPTLEQLRREHGELGLVFISGASDPGATLGKLGVTWIRKPFDIEEVVFVISSLARDAEPKTL